MIVNLDRYIISTIYNYKDIYFISRVSKIFFRIILAVLFAIVIAKPFELVIFNKEVNAEMEILKQELYGKQDAAISERYEPRLIKLENERASLKQEIQDTSKKRDALEKLVIEELEGKSPTGRPGEGPVYREKKAQLDQAEKELQKILAKNQLFLDTIEKEEEEIKRSIKAIRKSLDPVEGATTQTFHNGSSFDGLLARLDALGRVTEKNTRVYIASWFIVLLLICIETAPILTKVLSGPGIYEEILTFENARTIAKAESKRDKGIKITADWASSEEPYSELSRKYIRDFTEDELDTSVNVDNKPIANLNKKKAISTLLNHVHKLPHDSQEVDNKPEERLQNQFEASRSDTRKPISIIRYEEHKRKRIE